VLESATADVEPRVRAQLRVNIADNDNNVDLCCSRRQQMDSQQLYCQTHVSSQAADPDTGQHKDKLKVLYFNIIFLIWVIRSSLGTAATTGLKLRVGHFHYVSYPVAPF
jgi:hypothetical protein